MTELGMFCICGCNFSHVLLFPIFVFLRELCSFLYRICKQARVELGAVPPCYALHWWEPPSTKCWSRWERRRKSDPTSLRSGWTVWETSILAQILKSSSSVLPCQLLSLTGNDFSTIYRTSFLITKIAYFYIYMSPLPCITFYLFCPPWQSAWTIWLSSLMSE